MVAQDNKRINFKTPMRWQEWRVFGKLNFRALKHHFALINDEPILTWQLSTKIHINNRVKKRQKYYVIQTLHTCHSTYN